MTGRKNGSRIPNLCCGYDTYGTDRLDYKSYGQKDIVVFDKFVQ